MTSPAGRTRTIDSKLSSLARGRLLWQVSSLEHDVAFSQEKLEEAVQRVKLVQKVVLPLNISTSSKQSL